MIRFLSLVISFCSLFLLFSANAQAKPEFRFAVKGISEQLSRHDEYKKSNGLDDMLSPIGVGIEVSPGWRFNRYVGLYGDLSFAFLDEIFSGMPDPKYYPTPTTFYEMSFFMTPRAFIRLWKIDFYAGVGVGVRYGIQYEYYLGEDNPDNWESLLQLKGELGLEFVISERFAVGGAVEYVIDGFTRNYMDKRFKCSPDAPTSDCYRKVWTDWSSFGALSRALALKLVFTYKP